MLLCIFPDIPFDDAFENARRRKFRYTKHKCKFSHSLRTHLKIYGGENQTNASNMTIVTCDYFHQQIVGVLMEYTAQVPSIYPGPI